MRPLGYGLVLVLLAFAALCYMRLYSSKKGCFQRSAMGEERKWRVWSPCRGEQVSRRVELVFDRQECRSVSSRQKRRDIFRPLHAYTEERQRRKAYLKSHVDWFRVRLSIPFGRNSSSMSRKSSCILSTSRFDVVFPCAPAPPLPRPRPRPLISPRPLPRPRPAPSPDPLVGVYPP